jgi:hypothetical protein
MKMIYATAGKANARIAELEKSLSLEKGDPIFNIKRANQRIAELETMAAMINPSTTAAASAVKSLPSGLDTMVSNQGQARELAKAPARPPRKKLEQIVLIASPASERQLFECKTDDEVFALAERVCFQAHLRFPTMAADPELAAKYWRRDASTIKGLDRVANAFSKQRLETITAGTK